MDFLFKMTVPATVVFTRFLLIGAIVAGLGLDGVLYAAPRTTTPGTEIRVNREAGTLSVVTRDRALNVMVRQVSDQDNPVIEISGWRPEGRYRVAVSETAPVIFIDLYEILPGFKTVVLPVDMGWVKRLRLGHHPDRIRIALDGNDLNLPETGTDLRNDRLVIALKNGKPAPEAPEPLAEMPLIPAVAPMDEIEPVKENSVRTGPRINRTSHLIRQSLGDIADSVTTPDSGLFQDAITLFDHRQWAMARNKVQQLISRYPESAYAEKARFLLTDILTAMYGNDSAENYRLLADSFQEALNRYPESFYRGAALLGLARLHRDMGNHAEALAYYELARNRAADQEVLISRWAMLDTAKIHRVTGRMNQALPILEDILKTTDIPEIRAEALLETAKIRYEQNFFNESLNILQQLVSRDTDKYLQYPDVALYTGNNYFQLGRYDRARNHLFHYYNAGPDQPGKDMVLARVGDTFVQDGKIMDAVRCFLFVVDRYPGTRGAKIGWLRLAEQKERDPDDRIPMSYSAKQIYENIRDAFQGQPITDSLAQLALLKLALIYLDEKRYADSLETLDLFFENNPDRSLQENGRFALKNVVEAMIQAAYQDNDHDRVISLYTREARPVVPLMDPDPVLLMVARSYRDSGNSAAALALYQTVASYVSLNQAPDDVLFFTGNALFDASQLELAEQRLARLIDAYPQSPYVVEAMSLMGRILMAREKFREAVAMMTRALSRPLAPCDRAGLLVQTARAALAYQDMETALSTLETAREGMDRCPALAGYLGDQIGDLYFQAGRFDNAVSIFTHVMGMADETVDRAFLEYKTALSLWRSGQQEAGRDRFEALAAQNDPFWSRLAEEHLASESFDNAAR